MKAKLVVVGGGKMGAALAAGLLAAGWARPGELVVTEAVPERRAQLTGPGGPLAGYDGLVVTEELVEAEGAVIAVKPNDVALVCGQLQGRVPRVLSIAAGVTLGQLEGWLEGPVAVVRGMPNTPAVIGAGASAIAGGRGADEASMAWATSVLGAVGRVVTVPEGLMDAVTGLSGSGPAYVFLIAEALIDAGVAEGLPRPLSRSLAGATLLGAARLLEESGQEPSQLRAEVTSPGGTTAAGLRALEARAVRAAVIEAVAASAERSRAMGPKKS